MAYRSHKIVLVGDAATGKTREVALLRGDELYSKNKYIKTVGAEVCPAHFDKKYLLTIWDVGSMIGPQDPRMLNYYADAKICVVFGKTNVDEWTNLVLQESPDCKIHNFESHETLVEYLRATLPTL